MNVKSFLKGILPGYQKLILDYPVDLSPRYTSDNPHEKLHQIISGNNEIYSRWLEKTEKYTQVFSSLPRGPQRGSMDPFWDNGYFPGMDIIMLYTMLAQIRPKHYVEIGSGTSTRVAFRCKKDEALDTTITCIDPQPREEIDDIADSVMKTPMEKVNRHFFDVLDSGDVLFIDNSHMLLPNSDVTVTFLDILPYLKSGVIVHFHDIYLPYDYPKFMCQRGYAEQYALAIAILSNPQRYKTILPNYYIFQNQALHAHLDPLWSKLSWDGVERHGGSYWIEIS